VAVNDVIGTLRELEVEAIVKAVTVGATVSVVAGSVIVVAALALADTLPAASLAQAYTVLAPALAKV
jgi:hypothetical protein